MAVEKRYIGSVDINSSIDEIINFLQITKENGAVGCEIDKTGDHNQWQFTFIRSFRCITEEEIKQEKIKKLKEKLAELES